MNEIVDGLVCVLVSWGRVPVIRAPRNSLAAEIANVFFFISFSFSFLFSFFFFLYSFLFFISFSQHQKKHNNLNKQRLNAKLQEYLRQPNNPFYVPSSSSAPSHRPVLVLLDRSIDLSVMLRHSFTYQVFFPFFPFFPFSLFPFFPFFPFFLFPFSFFQFSVFFLLILFILSLFFCAPFQPLLHDLLNFNKNRVTCEVVEEKENKQERFFF